MNSRYVALLRGINVGGVLVKMDELKRTFETGGFTSVKTLLASGNVVFDAKERDTGILKKKIEEALKIACGRDINVVVRSKSEIQKLIASDPFQEIDVTPQTRLYVTFLSEKAPTTLKIPYESLEKDFRIVRETESEAYCVLVLSPNRGTVDLMGIVEREYGKKVTTRNWNTVIKIGKLLQ